MTKLKWVAICSILTCAPTIAADATIITVSNTNDSGPGSLRQALVDTTDGDRIDATGVSGVITLTGGELLVDKSVTINGAGADVLAVDGNATSSVVQISPGETVTISRLAIRNGHADFGSAIFNSGTAILTIVSSDLSANTAGLCGGIFNAGTLNISNSTVSGNSANDGGGTYSTGPNTTIINSTFSGNAALAGGGGSFNHGALQITNCTFSDNSADGTVGILNTGDTGNWKFCPECRRFGREYF